MFDLFWEGKSYLIAELNTICTTIHRYPISLKLGDYLSVQAHKPCSISHLHIWAAVKRAKIPSHDEILSVYVFFILCVRHEQLTVHDNKCRLISVGVLFIYDK